MGQIQGNLAPDLVSFFLRFFFVYLVRFTRLLYLWGKGKPAVAIYRVLFLTGAERNMLFCHRDAEEWFSFAFFFYLHTQRSAHEILVSLGFLISFVLTHEGVCYLGEERDCVIYFAFSGKIMGFLLLLGESTCLSIPPTNTCTRLYNHSSNVL